VVGHIIDVERIFAHRALRFARNDKTPLPEFDQDNYINNANFHNRTLIDIADEYRAVRESTLSMFYSFTDEYFARQGTASGVKFTVRAVQFIIAGHEMHHHQILREQYLNI
jgi:transposase